MQSKLVLFIVFALPAPSAWAQNNVKVLEDQLNSALPDDEIMELVEGCDLDSPAGTVIYMSHNAGARILIQMARDAMPEIGLTFIPELGAWINHSSMRTHRYMWLDSSYSNAAIHVFSHVKSWHTHTIILVNGKCAKDADFLRWTVPSDADLIQLYELVGRDLCDRACGVIASPLGNTTYCLNLDGYNGISDSTIRRMLRDEAGILEGEASKLKSRDLVSFADSHVGLVRMTFEFVP